MPASSTQYGNYQPNAVDPYPIESVLAPLAVGNNPANAANMLDEYQMQRLTDAGNYQYAANQQHDFAKQQLAQQLKEQYLKSAMDAVQHRGGLTVMNAIAPESLGNLSLGERANLEGGLTGLQNAKILEQSGSGAKSAAEAGRDITDEQAARASNGLLGPYGTPLSTRNILIKEANANARHAGGGGAEKGPGVTGPAESTDPNDRTPYQVNWGKTGGPSDARAVANLKARGIQPIKPPGSLPDTGAPPAPGTTPSAPSKTNLQPKPAASSQRGGDIRASAERFVENNLRVSNNAIYRDIQAGKVGGKLNMQRGADGRNVIKGATGTYPYIE